MQDDLISRQAVLNILLKYTLGESRIAEELNDLSPVNSQPKTWHCKNCKWWKDSDGLYRRGSHAESQCPINRREVFEGNGYCYMFEPQERSE